MGIAQGQAARFLEVAAAYRRAPAVTRERMYLDTMETVLGRANKVIVDTKPGAGGNIIYLPLDKLARGTSVAPRDAEPGRRRRPAPAPAGGQRSPSREARVPGAAAGGRSADGSRGWILGGSRWPSCAVALARCSGTVTEVAIRTRVRRHPESTITSRGCTGSCPGTGHRSSTGACCPQSHADETFLTNDNRGLIVDFYIKWRCTMPRRTIQATGGSEDVAAERLSDDRQGRHQERRGAAHARADRDRRARGGDRPDDRTRPAATPGARASSWWTCACSASTCPMRSARGSTRA